MGIIRRTSLCALVLFLVLAPAAAAQDGHGCLDGNLIPNCDMNNYLSRPEWRPDWRVPEGYTPYVLSGGLTYDQAVDTRWGAPSLRLWSEWGTFVAGVYTQVGGLQPGASYLASLGWGAPTEPDAFSRKLGIDPTGGTDPNSPNVVWGPSHRGPGATANMAGHSLDMRAVAKSSTVTVFVQVDHDYTTGTNLFFIDALGLYLDNSVPVQAPAAPTSPPAPVAAAPRPQPTRARPSTATATATATLTATASPTASATPTPTQTPTPAPTSTPTLTPTSTLPPRPQATTGATTAAAGKVAAPRATRSPAGLLYGGIGALGAGLAGAAVYARRRSR